MAKNATGTDVYAHHDGKTTVVHPGDPFPDGYEASKDLTTDPDDDSDLGDVPGPSQFGRLPNVTTITDPNDAYSGWKVKELRAALGEGNYDDGDRLDTLKQRAAQSGVDPAEKPSVS